jgi:Chalcone isomerase-like
VHSTQGAPVTLSRRAALAALLLASQAPAKAALPPELAAELPGARLHGSGTLRFMGLSVYDIRLWALQPTLVAPLDTPLALELQYTRALKGADIARRSLEEMARQGPIPAPQRQRWLAKLQGLLPDVVAGDRLTGVQRPGEWLRLFHNGSLRGEVADADFTRQFFGIWLAPATSEPRLRRQLLRLGET